MTWSLFYKKTEFKKIIKSSKVDRLVRLPFSSSNLFGLFGISSLLIFSGVGSLIYQNDTMFSLSILTIGITVLVLSVLGIESPVIWLEDSTNIENQIKELESLQIEDSPIFQDGDFAYSDTFFTVRIDNTIKTILWDDIKLIRSYKIDQFAVDCIIIEIHLKESSITIDDQTIGYMKFMSEAELKLPNFRKDWFNIVAFPPFETNLTIVYERSNLIKDTFYELTRKYTKDENLIDKLWLEIHILYTYSRRFYHNLTHIENLLSQLTEVKNKIEDWDVILFAAYYHDIIYEATSRKNEEKSADFAKKRLVELNFPDNQISKCVSIILATKVHTLTKDSDTDYFIDADLSILGQTWTAYSDYSNQVRQEYSSYPNFIYNIARKKVLRHFLKMQTIFKTEYFINKFENKARENILKELEE